MRLPSGARLVDVPEADVPILITIPLSHYSEKARWGLDRARIPYKENRHSPGFHALAVRRAGGQRSVPILVTSKGVIGDSSDILLWANERAATGCQLFPEDAAACKEVLALEAWFDQDLGPHVRRAIYFELLPLAGLAIPMWTDGVPRHERLLSPLFYRPMRMIARSMMGIDAAGAKESFDKSMQVMEEVSRLLADGRKYLTGDRFSAADITFAALAAPAVCPPGYAVPLPGLEDLPASAAALLRRVQDTPAAAFCLRMYREERR